MRQSSYKIDTAQKDIRAIAGDNFVNIPIKVKKADVSAKLVNGILKAGTLLTAEGKAVTTNSSTTDAFGIVYEDVDFNNSYSADKVADNATETVPVMIHGFVKTKMIKLDSSNGAVEKAALKMIAFL